MPKTKSKGYLTYKVRKWYLQKRCYFLLIRFIIMEPTKNSMLRLCLVVIFLILICWEVRVTPLSGFSWCLEPTRNWRPKSSKTIWTLYLTMNSALQWVQYLDSFTAKSMKIKCIFFSFLTMKLERRQLFSKSLIKTLLVLMDSGRSRFRCGK